MIAHIRADRTILSRRLPVLQEIVTPHASRSARIVVVGSSNTDHVSQMAVYLDEKQVEAVRLPSNQTARRFVAFWRYQLPNGKHTVRLERLDPAEGGTVTLDYLIVYAARPSRPPY